VGFFPTAAAAGGYETKVRGTQLGPTYRHRPSIRWFRRLWRGHIVNEKLKVVVGRTHGSAEKDGMSIRSAIWPRVKAGTYNAFW
jgi:hypothetical protein